MRFLKCNFVIIKKGNIKSVSSVKAERSVDQRNYHCYEDEAKTTENSNGICTWNICCDDCSH